MLRIGALTLLTGAVSGLVAGVLLATLARRRPRQGRRALGGVLLIIGLLCVYLDGTLYVNLYTWAHWCLGITALIIGVYGVQTFALGTWTRWLSALALVALVLSPWLGPAAFGPLRGNIKRYQKVR